MYVRMFPSVATAAFSVALVLAVQNIAVAQDSGWSKEELLQASDDPNAIDTESAGGDSGGETTAQSAQQAPAAEAQPSSEQTDAPLVELETATDQDTAELQSAETLHQSMQAGIALYEADKFKEASDAMYEAVQAEPSNSIYHHWLGKAYGRIAENSSNPLTQMKYAKLTGKTFRNAVALDEGNHEAVFDLITFLVKAPGFLGGDDAHAQELARTLIEQDPSYRDPVLELFEEEALTL